MLGWLSLVQLVVVHIEGQRRIVWRMVKMWVVPWTGAVWVCLTKFANKLLLSQVWGAVRFLSGWCCLSVTFGQGQLASPDLRRR